MEVVLETQMAHHIISDREHKKLLQRKKNKQIATQSEKGMNMGSVIELMDTHPTLKGYEHEIRCRTNA